MKKPWLKFLMSRLCGFKSSHVFPLSLWHGKTKPTLHKTPFRCACQQVICQMKADESKPGKMRAAKGSSWHFERRDFLRKTDGSNHDFPTFRKPEKKWNQFSCTLLAFCLHSACALLVLCSCSAYTPLASQEVASKRALASGRRRLSYRLSHRLRPSTTSTNRFLTSFSNRFFQFSKCWWCWWRSCRSHTLRFTDLAAVGSSACSACSARSTVGSSLWVSGPGCSMEKVKRAGPGRLFRLLLEFQVILALTKEKSEKNERTHLSRWNEVNLKTSENDPLEDWPLRACKPTSSEAWKLGQQLCVGLCRTLLYSVFKGWPLWLLASIFSWWISLLFQGSDWLKKRLLLDRSFSSLKKML